MIRDAKFDEVFELIKEKLLFPGIMGRVCMQACETRCKEREVMKFIAINSIKRAAKDYGRLTDEDFTPTEANQERFSEDDIAFAWSSLHKSCGGEKARKL